MWVAANLRQRSRGEPVFRIVRDRDVAPEAYRDVFTAVLKTGSPSGRGRGMVAATDSNQTISATATSRNSESSRL